MSLARPAFQYLSRRNADYVRRYEEEEDMMIKHLAPLALGALVIGTPTAANHIFNPGPYPSYSECQVENVQLSNEDMESLLARFPNLFTSNGEVRSFLTRAFSCELSPRDGQWYLVDHRQEVIDSLWFERRLD